MKALFRRYEVTPLDTGRRFKLDMHFEAIVSEKDMHEVMDSVKENFIASQVILLAEPNLKMSVEK